MGEYAEMAIEQEINGWYDDRHDYGNYRIIQRNPLYYHNYYSSIHLEAETDRAFLIQFNGGEKCWVAKTLCKKLTKDSVYIWNKATLKPIKENNE